MMKEEFLILMGWGPLMIDDEQYTRIERAYMNTGESKQAFCHRMYEAYRLTVVESINNYISSRSLEEKEAYLAGDMEGYRARIDEVRDRKMNQLIDLIS